MTRDSTTQPTPEEEAALGRAWSEEMRDPERYGAQKQECDLVMKGGIASGVVYPLTVCKLATKYRLRNIGGTSAGAIAAVLAAAAEHQRQQTGQGDGFAALAKLPAVLAADLQRLFVPNQSAGPPFALLTAAMGRSGVPRLARVLGVLLRHQFGWFVSGVMACLAIVLAGLVLVDGVPSTNDDLIRLGRGLVPAVLPACLIGLGCAVIAMGLLAVKVLPEVDFGLTNGVQGPPLLSEWIHEHVNGAAGRGAADPPLTLGDLWGRGALIDWTRRIASAAGRAVGDAAVDGLLDSPGDAIRRRRVVDLQMMTTDLTSGRPMRLPFQTQTFFFDADEFSKLFPAPVVERMKVKQSGHLHPWTGKRLWYFPGPGAPVSRRAEQHGVEPGWLPGPSDLPLVVMARMSLSFPGLISAVPLYAVDYGNDRTVVRHLFSDGGISSNFPIHFFDSLLPNRPTFGVNLTAPHPRSPTERTWRPALGRGEADNIRSLDSVTAFASALRDTMQNWSDNAQLHQRGYADRVVEIRLDKSEGGMNLQMDGATIDRMTARGAKAGEELLQFENDWNAHQIVRYRIAMARLTEALETFRHNFTEADYGTLLSAFPSSGPASSFVAGVDWRSRDRKATEHLLSMVTRWEELGWPGVSNARPSPSPSIRMAPQ